MVCGEKLVIYGYIELASSFNNKSLEIEIGEWDEKLFSNFINGRKFDCL